MANVAVRGQPVEDPWLTWSVPEYGEGFWPLPDVPHVNAMALARQAIPDALGPGTPPYPVSVVKEGPLDPATDALIYAETAQVDIDPAVSALIAAETANKKPAYYGPAASWSGTEMTFTGTLVGWGLLMRTPEDRNKVVPTLRAGRVMFGTGLIAGLIWGFARRDY